MPDRFPSLKDFRFRDVVPGLFMGCKAHFTLPPIAGVLPALVGWGIVKPIVVAWRASPSGPARHERIPHDEDFEW